MSCLNISYVASLQPKQFRLRMQHHQATTLCESISEFPPALHNFSWKLQQNCLTPAAQWLRFIYLSSSIKGTTLNKVLCFLLCLYPVMEHSRSRKKRKKKGHPLTFVTSQRVLSRDSVYSCLLVCLLSVVFQVKWETSVLEAKPPTLWDLVLISNLLY